MRKWASLLRMGVVACALGNGVPASAMVRMVKSPAELPAAGRMDWGQLGPPTRYGDNNHPDYWGTLVSTPFIASSTIGVGATITAGGTVGDALLRADAYDLPGTSGGPIYSPGNFDEGDRLLYSPYRGVGRDIRKPLSFTFSTPVRGFGAQGQSTVFGGYSLQIWAYDVNGNSLISWDAGGVLRDYYEWGGSFGIPMLGGSAAFLGVLSETANISSVVFAVSGGNGEAAVDSPYLTNTLDGDTDLDGDIDSLDFNTFVSHYGSAGNTWASGDFTGDGRVTTLDFNLLSANFGTSSAALGTIVPEPTIVALQILLLALHRRSRWSGHQCPR